MQEELARILVTLYLGKGFTDNENWRNQMDNPKLAEAQSQITELFAERERQIIVRSAARESSLDIQIMQLKAEIEDLRRKIME